MIYADNFSLTKYFKRINFQNKKHDSLLDTVTAMMRCHLCAIPFENLDVQAGKIVSLVPEEIVEKILFQHRGGYCYEINGLFSLALQALNVPHRLIAARPLTYVEQKPKTHMVVVAEIDGQSWLCDMGFGGYGINAPLCLDIVNTSVQQGFETFRLLLDKDQSYRLQTLIDGEWLNQYSFALWPQEWIDFLPANYFNSTHPTSIFVQKPLVVQHTATGRNILAGETLISLEKGALTKTAISTDEVPYFLEKLFGLKPPNSEK